LSDRSHWDNLLRVSRSIAAEFQKFIQRSRLYHRPNLVARFIGPFIREQLKVHFAVLALLQQPRKADETQAKRLALFPIETQDHAFRQFNGASRFAWLENDFQYIADRHKLAGLCGCHRRRPRRTVLSTSTMEILRFFSVSIMSQRVTFASSAARPGLHCSAR
jgi:hypothetical protein